MLSQVGDHAEAMATGREAVELYRSLAERNPQAHGADLAMAQETYAAACVRGGIPDGR